MGAAIHSLKHLISDAVDAFPDRPTDPGGEEKSGGAPMSPGAEAPEAAPDRWSFASKREREFLPGAQSILDEFEGGTLHEMVMSVVEDLQGKPLPPYIIKPYFNEWMGWGVRAEMIALACSIVATRPASYNYVKALHKIVGDFARRDGLL